MSEKVNVTAWEALRGLQLPNFSLLAGWMEPVEADLFYRNLYDNIEIYVEIMGSYPKRLLK